jgi:microcystin-dependent protein
MATDIQISQLNEVSCNNDLNHIIINDRENPGDDGITKKIQLCNFLTPNLVKETNIIDCAVTRNKIAPLSVDCSRIANSTITCNQIAQCGIANFNFDSNSVDNRALNNNCGFTVKCLTVNDGPVSITDPIDGCLTVESGKTKLNNITYYWPGQQTPNRFLKTNGAGGLSWEEAVPGESTSLVFSEIMPVGTIVPWAGNTDVPGDKWLECNGDTFEGTDYPELCAALGDTWGDPVNGFYYLPDLQGRVVIGEGTGADIHTDQRIFGFADMGGEYKHELTCDEMPSHTHNICGYIISNTDSTPRVIIDDDIKTNDRRSDSTAIQSAGGDQPHNNIQPYTVTRYIIKAKPDDVEQFNPTIGPGLSAADNSGQTANITLTSTEIGIKINSDNLEFDDANAIALKDDISASSIRFDDGTLQSTYEKAAFYTVEVAAANNYTTPSQFVGNVISTHDQYSKGFISTGTNNKTYTAYNSMLYTMNVKVLTDTTVTLYNYKNDDGFYVYVDGTLEFNGSANYNNTNTPREVTFALTTGNRKVEIVKNDSGSGSNGFDLLGNIISSNVLFLSGK